MPAVEKNDNILYKGGQSIVWTWTSDIGGAATIQTTQFYNGIPIQVIFDHNTDTGTKPTTAYDVTITNEEGYDILGGNGANLSSTGADVYKHHSDGMGMAVYSQLTLNVSNAGASKGGKVALFLGGGS